MLNDFEKENTGFISLWRCVTDWEWYTDVNTFKLFIHCLLKANYKDKNWQGQKIKRGSFVTSLDNLVFETGLSKMQIRTALKKLNLTHEITYNPTTRNSIIVVNNYDLYQKNNTQVNTQITHKQHTNNTQITLTNNDNNVNKEINNNISSSSSKEKINFLNFDEISDLNEERIKDLKNFYGEYGNVYLSPANYDKISTFVLNDNVLNELINDLSKEIAAKSTKYLPYDEKFPDAHYIYLKKFWNYRKNKPAEETKKSAVGSKKSARQRVVDYLINTGQMTKEGEFIE